MIELKMASARVNHGLTKRPVGQQAAAQYIHPVDNNKEIEKRQNQSSDKFGANLATLNRVKHQSGPPPLPQKSCPAVNKLNNCNSVHLIRVKFHLTWFHFATTASIRLEIKSCLISELFKLRRSWRCLTDYLHL